MATHLTHLALPCRDLDATIAWYADHTPMRTFHRRVGADTEVAGLAEAGSDIGLVVVQSFEARDSGEPQTILSPFAYLGFDVDGPAEVEAMAKRGRAEGCLHGEAEQLPPPIGYLCALADPDGNVVDFSFGHRREAFGSGGGPVNWRRWQPAGGPSRPRRRRSQRPSRPGPRRPAPRPDSTVSVVGTPKTTGSTADDRNQHGWSDHQTIW